jgi:hypothetical protein
MTAVPITGRADVSALEQLLHRLRACASADQAAALVERELPALVGADEAVLFFVDARGPVAHSPAADRWRPLACGSVAAGYARSGLAGDGRTEAAVAVPVAGASRPAGVLVLVHRDRVALGRRELGLVKLFAEHAGTSLRRLAA